MKSIILLSIIFFSNNIFALDLVLIGNDKRVELLKSWASTNNLNTNHSNGVIRIVLNDKDLIISTPVVGSSLIDTANLLYKSTAALLVVDSLSGLVPIDRDHIIISRQTNTNILGAVLTESILDQKIFNLNKSEIRQLMATYEMGSDRTPVYINSKSESRLNGVAGYGFNGIFKLSKSVQTIEALKTHLENTKSAYAHYYLLAQAEAMNKAIEIVKPTRLTLWSEGSTSEITAIPRVKAGPGGNAQVVLKSKIEFKTGLNSRNFILLDGRLVGAGVVTKIYH